MSSCDRPNTHHHLEIEVSHDDSDHGFGGCPTDLERLITVVHYEDEFVEVINSEIDAPKVRRYAAGTNPENFYRDPVRERTSRWWWRSAKLQSTELPPVSVTKFLFLVLPAAHRDCVIGDLDETYGKLAQRFDKRYAHRWYLFQAIRTILAYPISAAMRLVENVIVGIISK